MFPIPDAIAGFYLFCFAVGFLFVFASLFLGLSHDILHLPGFGGEGGGVDHGGGVEVGGHEGAQVDVGSADGGGNGSSTEHGGSHPSAHGISPINLTTIMAFLTWFGGAGYILRAYGGVMGLVGLVAAALAGLVGGAIIFYIMARVLLPGESTLDPADYRMEGTIARVTVAIRPDCAGEIVYAMGGSRRSDGARSVDGSTIERGTEVVVVRYERGIAFVEPWSSYVAKG